MLAASESVVRSFHPGFPHPPRQAGPACGPGQPCVRPHKSLTHFETSCSSAVVSVSVLYVWPRGATGWDTAGAHSGFLTFRSHLFLSRNGSHLEVRANCKGHLLSGGRIRRQRRLLDVFLAALGLATPSDSLFPTASCLHSCLLGYR